MAKTLGPDETYFQLATAKWRHKALKVLAAQNGTTMNAEVEAAIDARLDAHGISVGESAKADR